LDAILVHQKEVYGKDVRSILYLYQPILNLLTIYPKSSNFCEGEETCIDLLQQLMSMLLEDAQLNTCSTSAVKLLQNMMSKLEGAIDTWDCELCKSI
jgi:hypothetical protein